MILILLKPYLFRLSARYLSMNLIDFKFSSTELDPIFFLELYYYFSTRLSPREFLPFDTCQRREIPRENNKIKIRRLLMSQPRMSRRSDRAPCRLPTVMLPTIRLVAVWLILIR